MGRAEIDYASGFLGRLRGYPNARWPTWFDPTPVDLKPEPLGPFPQSRRLTQAGDVTLVPLPGHSPGHMGVLIDEGDHSVLLAGDTSHTEDLLLRDVIDGVGPDEQGERIAQVSVRAYAATHPTVYLVARAKRHLDEKQLDDVALGIAHIDHVENSDARDGG